MFFVGKKDGDVMEYDGGRIFLDIVNWVKEKFVENFFFFGSCIGIFVVLNKDIVLRVKRCMGIIF